MPECQTCGNREYFTQSVAAIEERQYHPETGEEMDAKIVEIEANTGNVHCAECGSDAVVM